MSYVYRHIRLDENVPFYIGIGKDEEHKRAKCKHKRSKFWNRIISKTDYRIEIIMDNLSWKQACEKEQEFIKLYGRKNLKKGTLANLTDGGEGTFGIKNPCTEEAKLKISKANKGNKHTEKAKKLISIAAKGRIVSEETRQKHRKNMSGNKHLLGHKHSTETIRKFKDNYYKQLGSKKEKEKRRKINLGNKYRLGKKPTEESKQKQLESMLKLGKRNQKTSSKYKGVCFDKKNKKWIASINYNGKTLHLGRFCKEKDAALAYNKKAFELYGKLVTLNIIS